MKSNIFRYMILVVSLMTSISYLSAQELYEAKTKAFKNLKKVEIAQFNVSFTSSEGKSASTQSIDNFEGAKSKLLVKTQGLNNELMQKITDEAYHDFVKKLEEKGLSVSDFDTYALADDYMKTVIKPKANYVENASHYQPHSYIRDITVSAKSRPIIEPKNQWMIGYVANKTKSKPLTVNYLINSGYLQAKAKKSEDNFLGKIYNKTNVTFFPGIQVFWRSGADLWTKKNSKGEIKINEHIYKTRPAGDLTTDNKSDLGSYKSATLILTIDPNIYYEDAIDVLKQANTKLVNAIAKAI